MIPIIGEVYLSKRRRKSVIARRHEPEDLLGVIAANERVRGLARWFVGEVSTGVRFLLASAAFFASFSAFGPWTTSVADRLPFVAVFFGSLVGFVAHLRYIE